MKYRRDLLGLTQAAQRVAALRIGSIEVRVSQELADVSLGEPERPQLAADVGDAEALFVLVQQLAYSLAGRAVGGEE